MIPEAARAAFAPFDLPDGSLARLERFAALLEQEQSCQNLVSGATLPDLWTRHFLDSAQLLALTDQRRDWLDIGSGAGLPGIVLACCGVSPITLVEPRRLRAEFLQMAAADLDLASVTVVQKKVEQVSGCYSIITARAVAALDDLFTAGSHLADESTIWLLPKGRKARTELDHARERWQGLFHVEPSITDPDAAIIVARQLRKRGA